MRRDMDLIRNIMLTIERNPPSSDVSEVVGYDWPTIAEHLRLMQDAGLLRGEAMFILNPQTGKTSAMVLGLSWAGYDFLDAARSDTNWNRAKQVTAAAGGWTFDLLKQVLVSIISQSAQRAIGQPL